MNGKSKLHDHGRFKFDVDNDKKIARLTVEKCKAADAGIYHALISNDCGEVDIEIPVQIVGE